MFRKVIKVLQQNRDFIGKNLYYPLECEIPGFRCLFVDLREVDWMIGELKRKERAAQAEAMERWWKPLLALGA